MPSAATETTRFHRVLTGTDTARFSGRTAIVARLDGWFGRAAGSIDELGALLMVDVEVDGALPLPRGDAEDRRWRLGGLAERALGASLQPGDIVVRIDASRFGVVLSALRPGRSVGQEMHLVADRLEKALVGRPEGYGARITAGGTVLRGAAPRAGQDTMAAVTREMLRGKLMTDDRVVVVTAPGG